MANFLHRLLKFNLISIHISVIAVLRWSPPERFNGPFDFYRLSRNGDLALAHHSALRGRVARTRATVCAHPLHFRGVQPSRVCAQRACAAAGCGAPEIPRAVRVAERVAGVQSLAARRVATTLSAQRRAQQVRARRERDRHGAAHSRGHQVGHIQSGRQLRVGGECNTAGAQLSRRHALRSIGRLLAPRRRPLAKHAQQRSVVRLQRGRMCHGLADRFYGLIILIILL